MKPSEKSNEVESFLDNIAQKTFGRKRTESIKTDTCVTCGGEASEFTDELSRKEFGISGMCQKCQDEVFGTHNEWVSKHV